MAAAGATGSSGATSTPRPSPSTPGRRSTAVLTTGTPRLIASTAVCDQASKRDGTTHTDAPAIQRSGWSRQPSKRTSRSMPKRAARRRNSGSIAPAPSRKAGGGASRRAIASSSRSGPFSGCKRPA